MDNKITAVVGIYLGLDRTINFLREIRSRFPDVHVAVGLLGNTDEYQETLREMFKEDSYIEFACGAPDRRVAFSENWNAACNLVKTERFVFLHNDMYIHDDFFKNLNQLMDEHEDTFFLYTTVEPLENQGFTRPGKVVAPFGHDVDEFQKDKFNAFAEKYIKTHNDIHYGYGFYLGGFTECLHKVGGFDYHRFFPIFCEDDDINLRIRLAGYRVIVADKALVYHFGSKTIRMEMETSMSPQEIESNRTFARKWGFEARFLWETGYENNDFSIGTEKIQYRIEGCNPSALDIVNAEPLVDCLNIDPQFIPLDYFANQFAEKLEDQEADIIITQTGLANFNELASLVGYLRFGHKKLKATTVQIGSYRVQVLRTYPDRCRVDLENYLSEQESIDYGK